MKKKKWIIVGIVCVALLVIISIVVYKIASSKKANLTNHNRYALSISVATKREGKNEKYSLSYKDDGVNAKITSNQLNYPVFFKNGHLTYIADYTKFDYPVAISYRDIDKIISKIDGADKIEERAEITRYSKVLTTQEIDKILEALYIKAHAKDKAIIQFSTKNGYLESCNLTLENTDNFDLISIILKFEELEEDYRVDVTSLSGNNHGIMTFYESKVADKNVLEIE